MSCGIGTMSATRVDVVAQDSGARTMAPVLAELEVAWAVPDTKVLVATGSVITCKGKSKHLHEVFNPSELKTSVSKSSRS